MYLKKASFASGELDPSLYDKTDIKSYYSGLKTARNVFVNKTGRIVNFPGTWLVAQTKNNDVGVRIYQCENTNLFYEFGVNYVRLYSLTGFENNYKRTFIAERVTNYMLSDLPTLQFVTVVRDVETIGGILLKDHPTIYVSCRQNNDFNDVELQCLNLDPSGAISSFSVSLNDFPIVAPGNLPGYSGSIYLEYTNTTSTPSGAPLMYARLGHAVQYGFTFFTDDGQESEIFKIDKYRQVGDPAGTYNSNPFVKLPTGNQLTEFTIKNFKLLTGNVYLFYSARIRSIRVYRKPFETDAFGLIGEIQNRLNPQTVPAISNVTTYNLDPNTNSLPFTDFGQEADYTNPPPEKSVNYVKIGRGPIGYQYFLGVNSMTTYNSRLLLARGDTFFGSKINNFNYFLRDFPLTDTTSFNSKLGTNNLEILHMLDANGLIVFTTDGVWYGGYDQSYSSLNPIIRKVGSWIIDEKVPPILTPYGVLFVDKTTNSVKTFTYNDSKKSMVADDISVYNNHLFYGKKVASWAFLQGDNPVLFVVLNDGTALTLTFEEQQQLMAWTRHDTEGKYESVTTIRQLSTGENYLSVVVFRQGENGGSSGRYIEIFSKRVLTDIETKRAFSHSSVEYFVPVITPTLISLTTFNGGSYSDPVKFFGVIPAILSTNVNKTFIAFTSDKTKWVYLTLISVDVGLGEAVFQPDQTLFAEMQSLIVPRLFEIKLCHTQVTGLTHLEGKKVSVISDNEVLSSPNNDIDNMTVLTVQSGGILNLPKPKYRTVVGIPYTSDIETLEIDSKDGTLSLDSKIVNDAVVRYVRTRGVYSSGRFSDNDKVLGMEDGESWDRSSIVNLPLGEQTVSKRLRPGSDWTLRGKFCLRQVDPLPLEIASIILDVSQG